MHQVIYTEKANEDLRNIDYSVAKRILKKILFFANQKDPLAFAKRLTNTDLGAYRFRIGDYRAIFDTDRQGNIYLLKILRIKHRKDIYNL
ncbi:MAG: hypothetical protein A2V81_02895 [Candidatus Abawacabacteria bacterium RBG_16_42_10]|uniref:Plasmid stabilization protein n=1 Tax=Candidatus Abawacabacteria bacterium RBG_16_42_10 TaxID=1817814 RepID=A0A1F4XKF3_9BACT|nr:MAG: hypothetical protein A2V81_02895 [Candidatus Abawacabacteria bacterium RBG_16_42_10]